MLAMSNEGYDTCPMEGFDSRRVKKILNLPFGAEVYWQEPWKPLPMKHGIY
jgi:nitroreductase